MSFYEEMYYNLPESERETFVNSLSDEDRKALMLALNKNNLCSNISSKHKSRFDSIYNELKDEKTKKSFIDIFNYLDEDKREILLDIVSNNINNNKLLYDYDSIDLIKDLYPEYTDKLNRYLNLRRFRRILHSVITYKMIKVLLQISGSLIKEESIDNSRLRISSFESKYNYENKNNGKLLNMLYKFPEEKRIYFFEEFERNEEFKNTEFIKMLRVILDMDKDSFLYIFKNIKELDIDNISTYYSNYCGCGVFGLPFLEKKEEYLKNVSDYMHSSFEYGYYNDSIFSDIYNRLKSKLESFFFLKMFESIIVFQIKDIIDIFESLDENMKESVNHFSSIVVLEKLEDYINLFSNKKEINKKFEEIKVNNDIKSDCNTNIDSNLYVEYVSECKNKLDSILLLIKDFDYASKEDYRKSCEEIVNILESNNLNNKEELNKIIDNINGIYKNVYYKYYEKSSLYYRMDIEEEGINYIRHIN